MMVGSGREAKMSLIEKNLAEIVKMKNYRITSNGSQVSNTRWGCKLAVQIEATSPIKAGSNTIRVYNWSWVPPYDESIDIIASVIYSILLADKLEVSRYFNNSAIAHPAVLWLRSTNYILQPELSAARLHTSILCHSQARASHHWSCSLSSML